METKLYYKNFKCEFLKEIPERVKKLEEKPQNVIADDKFVCYELEGSRGVYLSINNQQRLAQLVIMSNDEKEKKNKMTASLFILKGCFTEGTSALNETEFEQILNPQAE